MQFSTRGRRKASINNVPLTDIVFILLIFFTVTATFMSEPALKINPPKVGQNPREQNRGPEPMIIYLTNVGQLYFGDKPIRLDDLPELIKQGVSQGKSNNLTIKADSLAFYGQVIKILDLARTSGVDSVAFITQGLESMNKR